MILFVDAGLTTGDSITSTFDSDMINPLFNDLGTIYEISPSILDKGYTATVGELDAFMVSVSGKKFTLVISNLTDNCVFVSDYSGAFSEVFVGQRYLIDFNKDGVFDLELFLEMVDNGLALITLENYDDDRMELPDGYKELFDVEVGVLEKEIENSKDLRVYMRFVNFGEGLSNINIVYSIMDNEGNEVYRGVEERVVYTEDSLIKTFEFLELQPGSYSIYSIIFYGQNQTADSEDDFEVVVPESGFPFLRVLLVILIVGVLYFLVHMVNKKISKAGIENE